MKIAFSHTEINLSAWQQFVDVQPDSTFFHTPEYYHAFQPDEQSKSQVIAVLSDADEVLALSVFIIYKEKGVKSYVSRRAIAMAPPIVKENDAGLYQLILSEQNKFLKRKVIYCEIRNINKENLHFDYARSDFQLQKHLNIINTLNFPKENLFMKMDSYIRNRVRKAEKDQFSFQNLSFKDEFSIHKLLSQLYKRIQLPFFSEAVFKGFYTDLLKQKKIIAYGVFKGKELVSTMLVSLHQNTWYCWYMATSRSVGNNGCAEFLVWNVFSEAQKQGVVLFDWGGAGKPNEKYGVRDFKKKFGGEIIEQYRALRVYKPVLYRLAKIALKFIQLLKKKKRTSTFVN
jgi:lipid II:glycine glycyltransferase (peptidoglycan interpeptide bridge formation enzyme)